MYVYWLIPCVCLKKQYALQCVQFYCCWLYFSDWQIYILLLVSHTTTLLHTVYVTLGTRDYCILSWSNKCFFRYDKTLDLNV